LHHRLDTAAAIQAGQAVAFEIHDELAPTGRNRLAGTAAAALAGGDDPRDAERSRLFSRPVQAIAEVRRLARPGRHRRRPEGDDVVVRFAAGRDFDQLDRAFAPIPDRFDPDAGPPVIEDAVVLVVLEPAVALHQA